MDAILGLLLDVSDSMRQSIPSENIGGVESWANSIFKVVNGLIKNDFPENKIFAICFGAKESPYTFDLFSTIQPFLQTKEENLRIIIENLKNNGAPFIEEWVDIPILEEFIDDRNAAIFVYILTNNEQFRSRFIEDCIPDACKKRISLEKTSAVGCCVRLFKCCNNKIEDTWNETRLNAIKETINKGMQLVNDKGIDWKDLAYTVNEHSIFTAEKVRYLFERKFKVSDLTVDNMNTLMEMINPYIYGRTPLIHAMGQARRLFARKEFKGLRKTLFVLSDGYPTDTDLSNELRKIKESDIKVVGCFVTNETVANPKRLYCDYPPHFRNCGTSFLFRICSTVPTEMLPRTIFLKREWTIEDKTNETKLFFFINQPELIKDVCSFARDIVCSQDALSDCLSTVSLGLYINKANRLFKAQRQKGGTCYANASAAVLHLAMHRIVGRDGGYPTFQQLREEIVEQYGDDGANTWNVIRNMCKTHRLQCREVTKRGALDAIIKKRPVLAKFHLSECAWTKFRVFFKENPRNILRNADITTCDPEQECCTNVSGHAVVLSSFTRDCLRMMNSWGTRWGDSGFFRVAHDLDLGFKFMDVFWKQSSLSSSEKHAFKQYGPTKANQLLQRLVGLKEATFTCPLCSVESKVLDFKGRLVIAICPACEEEFSTQSHHDLVLNLYLTSLSNEIII